VAKEQALSTISNETTYVF